MFVLPAVLIPAALIALTVVLTAIIASLTAYVVGGLMRQSPPVAALGARRLAAIIVWLIGGSFALQQAGVSPDVVFVVVVLLGVAALIALRYPLENFGGKFFSDVYIPYKVGDTIRVGTVAGKVIEQNAMATVLLTSEDELVSVPNTLLLREPVVNTTPQAWKELTIPITVRATADLPAFESALLKSLSKLRSRLDPRFPPVLTTKGRSAQGTDLTLTLMIRRAEDRDALLGEASKRISEVTQAVQTAGRKGG
jgi:small conductance mechanosensitive channel